MRKIYPLDLYGLLSDREAPKPQKVAFDTETSGLFVDAGARVSTISVAWVLEDSQQDWWREWLGGEGQHEWEDGIWTLRVEVCEGAKTGELERGDWARKHWVLSFAWPYDQGALGTGKPEDRTAQVLEHGSGGLLAGLVEGGAWEPDRPKPDSGNLDWEQWQAICQWLLEVAGSDGLTAHNAKFDILQMEAGCRKWPGEGVDLLAAVGWDTMLGNDLWVAWQMARATGTRPTSALKPTGRWLWGEAEGDEQDVIKKYLVKKKLPAGRWDLMPWSIISRYAEQDARLTARLRKWQEAERDRVEVVAKRKGRLESGWRAGTQGGMERRMAVMKMLTRVERRGLPFNTEGAREASLELQRRIDEVEDQLAQELAGKVTLDMAKHYWFGSGDKSGDWKDEKGRPIDVRGHGYEPYARTEKGAPVVDVSTLGKMQRDGLPLVREWTQYKRLDDARSRWYDGWSDRAGADRRLRTSFRQVGTASGRFSVEGLQLQAIPADYRVEGTLAGVASPRDLIGQGVPEGYELWEMDLAQAELRVAAYMAGCQTMLDAIDRGADLHGETATALFGVKPGDPDWGEKRQVAKRSNFSLIFGVGWRTFQETLWKEAGIDMPEHEVRDLVYAWNALYPEYKAAIRQHEARVLRRYREFGIGWMQDGGQGMGERRWFPAWDVRVWNEGRGSWEETAHKAFNQRVQPALAQYGMDLWLGSEDRLRARYGDGEAGLCLMVHDSMVLLLPEGDGPEVCAELREWGRELWAERFPGLPGDLDASEWSAHA